MAFVKTKEYVEYKIANIVRAIAGTKNDLEQELKSGCGQNVIDAMEGQISRYEKDLVKMKIELSYM